MIQTELDQSSTLGREVTLRLGRTDYEALRAHLLKDPAQEQFAFVLFTRAKTADGTLLIARDLLLPGAADLDRQGASVVAPNRRYRAAVYLLAGLKGMSVLDVHTHTSGAAPRFSGLDLAEGAADAACACQNLPARLSYAMVVGNNTLTDFDGVVWDRPLGKFRGIDRMEVLGRRAEIRTTGQSSWPVADLEPKYGRQLLVPGWDQACLGRQRIAVVGAGGNGAQLLQPLIGMGAGRHGWIAMVDPDVLEPSNIPRIPYALQHQTGCPKVSVADQYAGHKSPETPFYPFPCSVTAAAVQERIKGATVLFGAGDNEGVRKVCNEVAARYLIPYIDLGCEIHVGDGQVVAGGQVRVVIPGMNACLVCCGAYDPAEAALELLSDEQMAVRAARGYVQGGRQEATPSIANLNGMTAQLAVTAFLALVHGERLGAWDYARFDQLTAETLVARATARDTCPVCGGNGFLGAGDEVALAPGATEPAWRDLSEPGVGSDRPVEAGWYEPDCEASAVSGGNDK